MDLKRLKVHGLKIKEFIAATQAASGLKNIEKLTPVLGIVLEQMLHGIIFMTTPAKELNLRQRELLKPVIN